MSQEPSFGGDKQLDYNSLLLMHLNRLSAVCTSNLIDSVNPSDAEHYSNPLTSGEVALVWGTSFLYSIVPDDFRDSKFKENYENLSKYEKTDNLQPGYNFTKLRIMINLLHRKGLLIQNKVIGKKQSKKKDEEAITQEDFE